MSGLTIGPSPLGLLRSLRRIPVLLAEVAARLHAVDPLPIDTALHSSGVDLPLLGDASYQRDIVAATETSASGFAELLRWFDDHRPDTPTRVVCHGDLHPLNLLVDEHGGVTVLDWTNANICPPELDTGFTSAFLRCAPIPVPSFVRPVETAAREMTRELASLTGITVDLPLRA